MTRTRRALLGAAAGIALAAGYSTPARAEMPVIDTAALGEWAHQLANDVKAYALQLQQYAGEVKSWATQNLQWLQQVQQYATQLQQYANELTMLRELGAQPKSRRGDGVVEHRGLGQQPAGQRLCGFGLGRTAAHTVRAACRKSRAYCRACRA